MRDKKLKYLVIVESPSKTDHFKEYLTSAGYNVTVMASVGHISNLADAKDSYKNSGVYPEKDFELNIKVTDDKYKVVKELKAATRAVDHVVIASDGDYEGEEICWSLIKFLQLPMHKYSRLITHEITPKAVVKAFENPVPVDNNAAEASKTRMAVDKLIGWSLSPIARSYLGCKSVGRCQSVGLKLVVDRENEILNFKPETFYDLYLNFTKNNSNFRAKFVGTDKEPVDHLKTIGEVKAIKAQCTGDFIIKDIQQKIHQESPKPPFCTSVLQQTCATKFGLRVKDVMSICQKLFENGFITYHRTDSTDLAPEFVDILKTYIDKKYPGKFTQPRLGKKTDSEQAGHEAIRCTDLELTPEKADTKIPNALQAKVYSIIWQRTVAAALPNAQISETIYNIYNNEKKFVMKSDELIDKGYRVVYDFKDEQIEEEFVKETFNKGEVLTDCDLESEAKSTTPPARYSEASLVKKLTDLEIGRPSTYATIVETLLNPTRNYAKLEDKKIVPTEKGMTLAAYLDRTFQNLINLNYTKELEAELDKIATGEETRLQFLTEFFKVLETSIDNAKEKGPASEKVDKVCPNCGATLSIKRSRFGKMFYACPNYPKCRYTENYE